MLFEYTLTLYLHILNSGSGILGIKLSFWDSEKPQTPHCAMKLLNRESYQQRKWLSKSSHLSKHGPGGKGSTLVLKPIIGVSEALLNEPWFTKNCQEIRVYDILFSMICILMKD